MPAGDVLSQFGWLAGAKLVQGVSSLVATLAIARALGPAEYGSLSLAIAVATFVTVLAALGLEQVATRELVSRVDAPARTLHLLTRLRWGGAIGGSCLLLGLAFVPQVRELQSGTLLLVLALLPLAQVGDLAEWRLIASAQGRRVAIVTASVSPVAALLRCALALAGFGALAFAWMLVVEWTVRSLLLSWLAGHPLRTADPRPAGTQWRQAAALLRESMPLLLSGLAVFAYMRIDTFMIAGMLGRHDVGLYSAIVALAELPLVLPMLLLRASLPVLTRVGAEDPVRRDRELMKLMGMGFYLHAGVACVLAFAAEPLLALLYGEAFRPAAAALQIQLLCAPFVALGVLSSAWLVLERKTGHALRRTLVGAVVNIGLNLVLIPAAGIVGAALATLVAQLLATYIADAFHRETRDLFMLKTRAFWPPNWERT